MSHVSHDSPAPAPARRVRLSSCLALLALALTSACGSTVQQQGLAGAPAAGQVGDGLGAAPVAAPTSVGSEAVPGAAGPAAGPGTSTTTGGSSAVGAGAPGQAPAGSAAGPAPAAGGAVGVPAKGPGWDEKNVYVGVVTQKDTQRVFASFGADYVDPGDTERQARAAADAVNAAGGVLGRQVKLVFRDLKILETNQNPSGVGESTCSFFTQDSRVLAVWNISTQVDQAPTFRGCLAKAGVPLFSAAARAVDDELLSSLAPHYYQSLMPSWTRLAPVLVARLKAQGYLSGWDTALGRPGSAPVVVGVLVQDVPEGRRSAEALRKAFASVGVGKVEVFAYSRPEDGQSASVQSFKGRGVTHVVVTDVELLAFQTSAASQNYTPRYGLNSYNATYGNLEAGGLSPAGANNGAVGVGWVPTLDVGAPRDPGPTPGWGRCSAAMQKQQQTFDGRRLAQTFAATLCDTMFLIKGGAEAGRGLDARALRAGIAQVGPDFPLAVGFGPAMTASAPFAPGVVRDLVWDETCRCMRYAAGRADLVP